MCPWNRQQLSLLHEIFDPILAESGLYLLRRDGAVLTAAYPRAPDLTMSAPLKILDGVTDSAAQDGPGHRPATKDGAQHTSQTA